MSVIARNVADLNRLYGEKAIHRAEIRRAKKAFFAAGGMVAVFAPGKGIATPMQFSRPGLFGKMVTVSCEVSN